MTLRRGFVTQAEQRAAQIRSELGLGAADAVDIRAVAKHLGMRVVPADELIDIARLHELKRLQAFAFSACTFDLNGAQVVVFNPLRTERTQSDIAHELSHLVLGHELSEIQMIADISFRTCRPDQEEEARSLGPCCCLGRCCCGRRVAALAWRRSPSSYGVTVEMARFRLNRTGVASQTRSGARRPAVGSAGVV